MNTAKAEKKDADAKNKEDIRKVNDSASTAKADADSKFQELTLKMTEATAEITEIKSENEELLRKLNTAKAAKKDAD